MGSAKSFDKEEKAKKMGLKVGIIMLLISLLFMVIDIYQIINLDRVEATLTVTRKYKGYVAYATYEYLGVRYEEKCIKSCGGIFTTCNTFVMKDGKSFTVLIDPAKPDIPQATNFGMEIFVITLGIAFVIGFVKENQKGSVL